MRKLFLTALLTAGLLGTLTSCDALWDTSVGTSSDDYYVGSSYYPNYTNPLYWGNSWYPGVGYYPAGSVYPGPVRPGLSGPGWGIASGSTGNVRPPMRPGTSSGNKPVTLPAVPPQQITGGEPGIVIPSGNGNGNVRPGTSTPSTKPAIPRYQITGGEPGIVMPPAGSGLVPVKGRH